MKKTTKVLVGLALALSLAVFAGVIVLATDEVAAVTAGKTIWSPAADTTSSPAEAQYAEGIIDIALDETISVSGEGATVDGTTVTITAAGVYHISGTLADGQIDVDAQGKVYLEFDGVDITCGFGPALNITDAKKVTLTLVEGTTNRLSDAPCDTACDAALFTNDTLVINGGGSLVVTGNNNEGISSDDDIIINCGTILVTAVDDGLNAHDDITVTDGEVYVLAGGDGLDSNGTITINGGTLVAFGGTDGGDGGLDAIGAFTITGGTVLAGGNNMAAPDSASSQCSLYVVTGSMQTAGTSVRVERYGKQLLTITCEKEFQNLLVSPGGLIDGATYQVHVGQSATALSVTAAISPEGAGSMAAVTEASGQR